MNFQNFYTESILDVERGGLDPVVWTMGDISELPMLNPGIKAQIMQDVLDLQRTIQINKSYIIGSILTKNYNKDSDIDVTIEVNKEDLDEETGVLDATRVISLLRTLNGKMAYGTTHPINYYITVDFDEENADGIYDLATDQWIKEPASRTFDVNDYMKTFTELVSDIDLSTGQLRRDVLDYNELKDLDEHSVMNLHSVLSRKLYEINKNVESLVAFKASIKSKRQNAFAKPMTQAQIVKYAHKNRLPANVIYKLFQRYYYFDLIHKLDEIIDNRDKDGKYVDKIEDVIGYQESMSLEEFVIIDEKIRKISAQNVHWTKPKSVRKYKNRSFELKKGLASGTNLRQVPDSQRSHRHLGLSDNIVNTAKRAPSGIWRLTPAQVREIANKYHHIIPNRHDPIKHLGNTGIVVWRKTPSKFYLVKHRGLGMMA